MHKVLDNNLDKYRFKIRDENSNIEAEYMNKELAAKIENISHSLKPKQRIVFVLRDLQDLNINEIAEALGISTSAVKTNLFYARKNILKVLEKLKKN